MVLCRSNDPGPRLAHVPPGNDNAPTLGEALRAAREQAGVSIERVSAETRIRATVIRDLEGDSFRSSGGSVYARGHVKSISRALNIDPAPLLALFDAAQGKPGGPAIVESAPPTPEFTSFGGSVVAATATLIPERHGPRWGLAVTAACAALVAIIGIGYLNQPSSSARRLADSVPTPSATPSAEPVHTPDPGAVASKPVVTGAQLRIRLINGHSWFNVTNSLGKTIFEGILNDGEFRDFSDPTRLKVVVGNPSAVNLNCDGHDSGQAGGAGRVATFACTTAGLSVA